jgi:hypothetical protein
MATILDEFVLKNIDLWWRYGISRHCDEWKYIIIRRIFESKIILIPPSLKISESSSMGAIVIRTRYDEGTESAEVATSVIEWWQQRIAWWELLNAACKIICIHVSVQSLPRVIGPYTLSNWRECKDRQLWVEIGFSDVHPGNHDHICKSSPMIHCGNRSFLKVTTTWQMFESESEMAKWESKGKSCSN